MAVTVKELRLTFTTAENKTFLITMVNPKEGLAKADVVDVMNTIIEKNIFLTSSGALTGIKDIKTINRTTDDLYDPSDI